MSDSLVRDARATIIKALNAHPGREECVAVAALCRDTTYQQNADGAGKAMGDWCPALAGRIIVFRRSDGSLFVADGLHRVDCAKHNGVTEMDAWVVEVDDPELERATYLLHNSVVGVKKSVYLWWAAVGAGEYVPRYYQDIIGLLGKFDIRVSVRTKPGHLACPKTIVALWKKGTLAQVLTVLTEGWSENRGYESAFLVGVDKALLQLPAERVLYVLREYTREELLHAALGMSGVLNSMPRGTQIARVIVMLDGQPNRNRAVAA